MISLVLYGRNDSYGYNLHKRAALSLNCFADVLSDPDDEIIFVDYNTPDDFPTFPEAIEDTLTAAAKERLRVLRVRPSLHRRFQSKTHLVALEPIARNIAIRRSCPRNRWILSTNTDIILVPRRKASLSDVARDLPAGFYHLPRFEIPESLWEGFNRLDPAGVIGSVRDWGAAAHLNEIVFGNDFIKFDGPGDFQLIQRQDLFDVHGLDERMLLGWHVDSNLAKRLCFKHGQPGDLLDHIFAYHCDHTRQVTPAHRHDRIQNDPNEFVYGVKMAAIPEQADSWGCPDDQIEELRLADSSSRLYMQVVRRVVGAPMAEPTEAHYRPQSYDKVDCDPQHLLPFLIDLFINAPRGWNVAWFGRSRDTLNRFARAWQELGFTGHLLLDQATAPLLIERAFAPILTRDRTGILADADAFIFDFGLADNAASANGTSPNRIEIELVQSFSALMKAEEKRTESGNAPRRIVTLNTIHNRFESMILAHIGAAATPFSTRIRQGYIRLRTNELPDCLMAMTVGEAGERTGKEIRVKPGHVGVVCRGPNARLQAGVYCAKIRLRGDSVRGGDPDEIVLALEVGVDGLILGYLPISRELLEVRSIELPFELPETLEGEDVGSITMCLRSLGEIDAFIEAVSVERSNSMREAAMPERRDWNWLHAQSVGDAGERVGKVVRTRPGRTGCVIYGPYWRLPKGQYRCRILYRAEAPPHTNPGDPVMVLEVAIGGETHAHEVVDREGLAAGTMSFEFAVAESVAFTREAKVQLRLRCLQSVNLMVERVTVEPLAAALASDLPRSMDWLPLQFLGEAGWRDRAVVRSKPERSGFVLFGPYYSLPPGQYQLRMEFERYERPSVGPGDPALAMEIVTDEVIRACRAIDQQTLASGSATLEFGIPESLAGDPETKIEARLQTLAPIGMTVKRVLVERTGDFAQQGWGMDFLPLQTVGQAGERVGALVRARRGQSGCLLYGPYRRLPAGEYLAKISFEGAATEADDAPFALEVVAGNTVEARRKIDAQDIAVGEASLAFMVSRNLAAEPEAKIQIRLHALRPTEVAVQRVLIERVGDPRLSVAEEQRSWPARQRRRAPQSATVGMRALGGSLAAFARTLHRRIHNLR
jgi:hypothetical protein